MSADEAMAAEIQAQGKNPGPEVLDAATAWLLKVLSGGPRLVKELIDEWKNGNDGSERTLKRAKSELRVEAFRNEIPGPWWWRLQDKAATDTKHGELGPLGTLAENKGVLADSALPKSKDAKMPELGSLGSDRVQVTI